MNLDEQKQKAAEEYASTLYDPQSDITSQMHHSDCHDGFKAGADWATDRMSAEVEKYRLALEKILDVAESSMGSRVPVIIQYAKEALLEGAGHEEI